MRKKKFIIAGIIAAVVIIIGGSVSVALAQSGGTTAGDNQTNPLFSRVAAILGIDEQKLEDAFAQAHRELRDEASQKRLQSLVDEGKITQEQADQYQQWWQARPDVQIPAERFQGHMPNGKGGELCPPMFRAPRPAPSAPTNQAQ